MATTEHEISGLIGGYLKDLEMGAPDIKHQDVRVKYPLLSYQSFQPRILFRLG